MKDDVRAVLLGKQVARRFFDDRSKGRGRRNVEVHVSEEELAALVSLGIMAALKGKEEQR